MTEFKTSLSFSSYYSGDESPNVKLPQFMYIDGKMMHIATPSQTGKRYFKDIAKNIVPIPPMKISTDEQIPIANVKRSRQDKYNDRIEKLMNNPRKKIKRASKFIQ